MTTVLNLICKYIDGSKKYKINRYDETIYIDTFKLNDVPNSIKSLDYLAGPSTLHILEKDNKKVILFGDIHIGTKDLICANDSNNIVYVTDYLKYLFDNTKLIYDVYTEIPYIKGEIPLYNDTGMIPQVNNKFKECITNIMDLSKCPYKNNVRFHNVDIRENVKIMEAIFYKSKYFDTIFYIYIQLIALIPIIKDDLSMLIAEINKLTIPEPFRTRLYSFLNGILKEITNIVNMGLEKPKTFDTNLVNGLMELLKLLDDVQKNNTSNKSLNDMINKFKDNFNIVTNIINVVVNKDDMKLTFKILLINHIKMQQNYNKLDPLIKVHIDKYIDDRINKIFSVYLDDIINFLNETSGKNICFNTINIKNNNLFYFDIHRKYYKSLWHYSFFTQVLLFDLYLLFRLLKKFDISHGLITQEYAQNSFIITGYHHTIEFVNFLKNYLGYIEKVNIKSEFYNKVEKYLNNIPDDILDHNVKYKCIKIDAETKKLLNL